VLTFLNELKESSSSKAFGSKAGQLIERIERVCPPAPVFDDGQGIVVVCGGGVLPQTFADKYANTNKVCASNLLLSDGKVETGHKIAIVTLNAVSYFKFLLK